MKVFNDIEWNSKRWTSESEDNCAGSSYTEYPGVGSDVCHINSRPNMPPVIKICNPSCVSSPIVVNSLCDSVVISHHHQKPGVVTTNVDLLSLPWRLPGISTSRTGSWYEHSCRQEASSEVTCHDNEKKKCKDCGCSKCGGKNDPDSILICDECQLGFHLKCVGLKDIPADDEWFCPDCKNEDDIVKAGEKQKDGKKKKKMASKV